MSLIQATNVNDAFFHTCRMFVSEVGNSKKIQVTGSRNGDVLRYLYPLTVSYENPVEKVLYNQSRDCNPFFHVYESLWMLAGRRDLAPLTYFVKTFGNYSDNGKTLHGAYGYRWARYFGYNQLEWIIDELKENPDSRRCVLQMWDGGMVHTANWNDVIIPENPEAVEGTGDLFMATNGGKDVPCNLSAVFQMRNDRLDMTVFNRSNDVVLGMMGANVVHFAFLQEYMAKHIGALVGRYHQISANAHIYLEKNVHLRDYIEDPYSFINYPRKEYRVPLVKDPQRFDVEVQTFIDYPGLEYEEPFLETVAKPMVLAFSAHKDREYQGALDYCNQIASLDWRFVSTMWIEKRKKMYEERQTQS